MTKSGGIRGFIRGVIDELRRDRSGEQVLEFMVHEIRRGRRLEDVLGDPYVRNRISESDAERLLASPEVIQAVEEGLVEAYHTEQFGFKED